MNNVDKTISLLTYMKELSALKHQTVRDIAKQRWVLKLRDIPSDPENIRVYTREGAPGSEDATLLSVHKPEFTPCPEPPADVAKCFAPGWDRYDAPLKRVERAPDEEPPREKNIEKWCAAREIWAEREKRTENVRALFLHIYEAYTDLRADPETLEMMAGNGVVAENGNPAIRHPALLRRVRMAFDSLANTIAILDADADSELYTVFLNDVPDIDYGVVKDFVAELNETDIHPFDGARAGDFMKSFTHRLCAQSRFVENDADIVARGERVVTRMEPVFFVRRRLDGTMKAIDDIIADVKEKGEIPGHINDIIGDGRVEPPLGEAEDAGIDAQLAALGGESGGILLAKQANREQMEIAERVEKYNTVLVQGPPGTGKTHTIANLTGHFLAQGKSVLVTSQKGKALTVLKEKLPEGIQNLCVSVLDDSRADMERSVDAITEFMAAHTSRELLQKAEAQRAERAETISRLGETRRRIYTLRRREFSPFTLDGRSYSPAEAARFVADNAELSDVIPGAVTVFPHAMPLLPEEARALYAGNGGITPQEEKEAALGLPAPDSLPAPDAFRAMCRAADDGARRIAEMSDRLGLRLARDADGTTLRAERDGLDARAVSVADRQALADLQNYVKTMPAAEDWMAQAALDGSKKGAYLENWEKLLRAIDDACAAAAAVGSVLGKKVEVRAGVDAAALHAEFDELARMAEKKGALGGMQLLFKRQLKNALAQVTVNGAPPAKYEDVAVARDTVALLDKRRQLAFLWNELPGKNGMPAFETLGDAPEEICARRAKEISRYLRWYDREYKHLLELMRAAGMDEGVVFAYEDMESGIAQVRRVFAAICHRIPLLLEAAETMLRGRKDEAARSEALGVLTMYRRKDSEACRALADALRASDPDAYETAWRDLSALYEKSALQTARAGALSRIRVVAPDWADAVENRRGVHGLATCPERLDEAWKWKQLAAMLDDLGAESLDSLQKQAVRLSDAMRAQTAALAESLAWYYLLLRVESNLGMKQDLQGWKQTVKRIGKGTGKNVPMLRAEARRLMGRCQKAVPAWIMPVGRAMESLNPVENLFDVVIIDEASQSDVTALALLYMGKKVIVVGDDRQVSPLAVGTDLDRLNALREMYIKGVIPNWQLYDAKTSLYDIAATTYQALMLREHFRCVPAIIGYSNRLSYDNRIKPLRDASDCPVKPSVVPFRVRGVRAAKRKVNEVEAESVVALLAACMEQEEYAGETFGVISLLGEDQVKRVQQIVYERIPLADIEKRRLLCGDASGFQGDERDVVFVTMVDSNEGDGPLKLSGEGVDQSTKQRYNVAVSRARDQLWIVHSLDYTFDLKQGDIRRDLLEYADNPAASDAQGAQIAQKAESPFEEEVARALSDAGYHIAQQWQAGAYRIDIVAIYQGKKIAIECDGEAYHSGEEKIRQDMERQSILERIGWTFVRIRGSEYYRDREAAMRRVTTELNGYGILPERARAESDKGGALLARVVTRAEQIMDEWHTGVKAADVFPRRNADGTPESAPEDPVRTLTAMGFSCADERARSGDIWVLFDPFRAEAFAETAERLGLACVMEPRGAAATDGKAAWRLRMTPDIA